MHVSAQDKREQGPPYLMLCYFSTLNLTMSILSAPFWGQVLWPRVTVLFLFSRGLGSRSELNYEFLIPPSFVCIPVTGTQRGLRCSHSLKKFFSEVLVTFSSCYQPLSRWTNSFCLVLSCATWLLNYMHDTVFQNESAQK